MLKDVDAVTLHAVFRSAVNHFQVIVLIGSGGMIRNYNHRNFHEIFLDYRCKPFSHEPG
jgi:uridylate kinase